MQIFVIKWRIFLTRLQIDSSLFDRVRVMKILYMLTKIYRYIYGCSIFDYQEVSMS